MGHDRPELRRDGGASPAPRLTFPGREPPWLNLKENMLSKIPTTVITGFLGAGKTTLIRHLLQNAKGRRLALIINEFGDLGVDGGILKGCGIETCREEDVIELNNGCICCTVG